MSFAEEFDRYRQWAEEFEPTPERYEDYTSLEHAYRTVVSIKGVLSAEGESDSEKLERIKELVDQAPPATDE